MCANLRRRDGFGVEYNIAMLATVSMAQRKQLGIGLGLSIWADGSINIEDELLLHEHHFDQHFLYGIVHVPRNLAKV